MRTMLLSFKPEWYNRIKDGSKIFEYRRTFPDEEIMAYMYVSSPMKMIVGRIHLGRRIDINTWKEQYKDDMEVCERIDDFISRHTYAMPVLSFQMTKEIDLGHFGSLIQDLYVRKCIIIWKIIRNCLIISSIQQQTLENHGLIHLKI